MYFVVYKYGTSSELNGTE